jgi:transposase
MKTTTKIEWIATRYKIEQRRIEHALNIVSQYEGKTSEQAQKMFDEMPAVTVYRRNGWLNEEERWAIAFYSQKLPRRTSRYSCGLHLYEIAAKFAVSLPTVYAYSDYNGCCVY